MCPITHSVFQSPVITVAGTVYEEEAIKEHLHHTATDPLTNAPLTDARLTPVFLLRRRAKEYATFTANTCIDRALQAGCRTPAQYLRRACDLCDEAGAPLLRMQPVDVLPVDVLVVARSAKQSRPYADVLDAVPLLSAAVLAFARQHRGAVHDVFVLMHFGTSLAEAGHVDSALAVFATILHLERERGVQIAVVKRCLSMCWTERGERAPREALEPGQPRWNTAAVARFIATQDGLPVADFVRSLGKLGVPTETLRELCMELLAPEKASEPVAAAGIAARLALVPLLLHLASDPGAPAAEEPDPGHQEPAPPERRPARTSRIGRVLATSSLAVSVLVPGAFGRLLAAAPVIFLLQRPLTDGADAVLPAA